MKKLVIKQNDKVTCKHPVEAYYSNYAGNKRLVFEPGMVGVVAAIAPKVHLQPCDELHDRNPYMIAVDFDCPVSGKRERASLNYINCVKLKGSRSQENEMQTKDFIKTAMRSVSYNAEAKELFHKQGAAVLRRLAKALGYSRKDFDLRHNQGGIAISGEITLHSDTLYVQFAQSWGGNTGFMWRTCRGRKDYTGRRNQWTRWVDLKNIKTVASTMLAQVKQDTEAMNGVFVVTQGDSK